MWRTILPFQSIFHNPFIYIYNIDSTIFLKPIIQKLSLISPSEIRASSTSQNIFQIPIILQQRQQGRRHRKLRTGGRDTFRVSNRSHHPFPSLSPSSLPPLAPSAQVLLARNAWSFCRAAQSKAAPVECYNFALPLPSPPPTPAPSLFSSQSPFIYPAIFLTPTSPPGLSPPLSRWRNERLLSLPAEEETYRTRSWIRPEHSGGEEGRSTTATPSYVALAREGWLEMPAHRSAHVRTESSQLGAESIRPTISPRRRGPSPNRERGSHSRIA